MFPFEQIMAHSKTDILSQTRFSSKKRVTRPEIITSIKLSTTLPMLNDVSRLGITEICGASTKQQENPQKQKQQQENAEIC